LRLDGKEDDVLPVRLESRVTEVGTLELWCESRATDHRWRLQFQLHGAEGPVEVEATEDAPEETRAVIPDETFAQGVRLIRAVFGRPHDAIADEPARYARNGLGRRAPRRTHERCNA
jgi:hypothetical protein